MAGANVYAAKLAISPMAMVMIPPTKLDSVDIAGLELHWYYLNVLMHPLNPSWL